MKALRAAMKALSAAMQPNEAYRGLMQSLIAAVQPTKLTET